MKSPAEDIATLLSTTSGFGLVLKENLFVSEEPASPDACVSIFDTTEEPGDPRYEHEKPRFQVRLRGGRGDYRPIYALAKQIKDRLLTCHGETIGSTRYIGIWLVSGYAWLGRDGEQRPRASMNFRVDRTPAA